MWWTTYKDLPFYMKMYEYLLSPLCLSIHLIFNYATLHEWMLLRFGVTSCYWILWTKYYFGYNWATWITNLYEHPIIFLDIFQHISFRFKIVRIIDSFLTWCGSLIKFCIWNAVICILSTTKYNYYYYIIGRYVVKL
jgi:hypothetical protein